MVETLLKLLWTDYQQKKKKCEKLLKIIHFFLNIYIYYLFKLFCIDAHIHIVITESLCVNHSETHVGLHRRLLHCKLHLTLRAVIEMSTLGSNSL